MRVSLMHSKRSETSDAVGGPSMWGLWAPRCLLLVTLLGFSLRVACLDNLPLSLSLDESVDGLDALQLLRTHWLTPFLQNYFGRETLFFYVQSTALWLYGINQFSLRFASVAVGTLAIPLTYVVSQQLRLDEIAPARWVPRRLIGLLAAAGLATSYWHVYFSRVAQRAILLLPLLLCLVYCLWRGWQFSPADPGFARSRTPTCRRRLWLVAAGALLGLSLYTHLAARVLPFMIGLFVIVELLRERKTQRARVADSLVLAGAAALVSVPLVIYFVRNPLAFSGRTDMVSILNQDTAVRALAINLLRIVRIQLGGGSWLGHWPSLNLLMGLGLLSGLFVCVARIRRPAARFLLMWLGIGFLPVLLSQQEWERVTTIQRGIVAWPAVFLVAAVGLWSIFGAVAQRAGRIRHRPAWLASPLVLVLLFGMLQDAHSYFFTWARAYDEKDDDPRSVAAYLNQQTSQVSLTPSRFYANPKYNLLLQARYNTVANIDADSLHSLLASGTGDDAQATEAVYLMPHEMASPDEVLSFVLLVPSTDGNGTAYLLPPLRHAQAAALLAQTQTTSPTATILNGQGEAVATAYPLSADAPFLPVQPISVQPIHARFGDDILLDGYLVEPSVVESSDPVGLYLRFQAQRWIDGDYALFVHVVDIATGQRWAQVDTALGGSTQLNGHRWPPGLVVLDLQQFQLPPAAPDGAYRFEVGVYRRPSTTRLPAALAGADYSSDEVVLGKFRVVRQPPRAPQFPLRVKFEDNVALNGLDLAQRGSMEIALTLYWQALGSVTQDYTVFTHLLDEGGNLLAQQDNVPQGGRYPTTLWSPEEIIPDHYELHLTEELVTGRYRLWVGMYEVDTGQRLRLAGAADDHIELPLVATDGGRVMLQVAE